MAKEIGMLVTCDRCGQTIFLKHIGTEDLDGGYTKYNKFESLPDTWLYETPIGHLCESCAYVFRKWITEFKDGHVAPSWHVDKHNGLVTEYGPKECEIHGV